MFKTGRQLGNEVLAGLAAVTQLVFNVRWQLSGAAAVARDKEQRVVAESAVTLRRAKNFSPPLAVGYDWCGIYRVAEHHHTTKKVR